MTDEFVSKGQNDLGSSIRVGYKNETVTKGTIEVPKGQIRTLEFLKEEGKNAVTFENGINKLKIAPNKEDTDQMVKEITETLENIDLSKTEKQASVEFVSTLEGLTPSEYIKDAEELLTLLGKDESKWLAKISDGYSEEEKELLFLTSLAIFQDLNDTVIEKLRLAVEKTSDILIHYFETNSEQSLSDYIKEIIPFYSFNPKGKTDTEVSLISVFKLQAELILKGFSADESANNEMTLQNFPFLHAVLNREIPDPKQGFES